jgi:hypothetical protein
MNFGICLGISQAIAFTNGNEVKTITVWETVDEEIDRHSIECSVWEFTGRLDDLDRAGDDDVNDLQPHGGRCHSFQYRYETWDEDEQDWELEDADEAMTPLSLIASMPDELKLEAASKLIKWLRGTNLGPWAPNHVANLYYVRADDPDGESLDWHIIADNTADARTLWSCHMNDNADGEDFEPNIINNIFLVLEDVSAPVGALPWRT